ncbi:hypothetical protein ACJDU8_10515 [Clostridium sp. WILCCON 0269]|uniref:Uncharacterized protein n=1 Tax=Candidatus Clostridium eludens TaxID=3381663 RepID=A0ABW8SJ10_9CLOT
MLKNKFKLISAIMLAAPLLVNTGIATTVHACTNTQPITHVSAYYTFVNFEAKINSLVAAGSINQAQQSTILNLYYSGKITTKSTFKAELDALVAAGTITQSQEISILNLFTSWGSDWKIPAPINHNNDKSDKNNSKSSGTKQNTPTPSNSKQNAQKSNDSKTSNAKQNNSKLGDLRTNAPVSAGSGNTCTK